MAYFPALIIKRVKQINTSIISARAMAAVIAELAEGAVEGGEEQKGFKSDSSESAQSEGVNPAKIAEGALSVAGSIMGLVVAIKKGKEQTADIRERRLAAGLTTPRENRKSLLLQGAIPPYYAPSHIKKLIKEGIMPFGWNPVVASSQGFAGEVQAFLIRQHRSNIATRRDADLKRRLTAQRIQASADDSDREARTAAVISRIRQSIVA